METIIMHPNETVYWYNEVSGIFQRIAPLKKMNRKIKNIMGFLPSPLPPRVFFFFFLTVFSKFSTMSTYYYIRH